jgi:tetratricopeptide (TPR) repeat protein
MKRLLLIALILLTMGGLFAANQTSLLARSLTTYSSLPTTSAGASEAASATMAMAKQLYEMGQFAQAAQAYQQLIDQGFADASLFYNLGNAYYKQEDYGQAILYYRRAQQLAPRDPDIETNLKLARAQAVDQFEAAEEGGLLNQLGQSTQAWFTLNELAMAALGIWILFMSLLLLRSAAKAGGAWRKGLQYALVAAGIVLVVGLLAMGSSLYATDSQPEGVIVAAEVDISSGPGSQYVTEFTLHSGAEVDLVETRGNWVRLALPGDELEGWVPASAVASVTG